MTYELAKELKDAGFPQGYYQPMFDELKEHPERAPVYEELYEVETLDAIAYQPTLSELIEACGEDFNMLMVNEESRTEGWSAFSAKQLSIGANGSTPEEAVARLWLALNKRV